MRDIKFKGKNKDIGWVYGQLVYDVNGNAYIIQEVELDSSYGLEETMLYATMWYRVENETIGQYTGLNDKNGKEIYEGDIVKVFTNKEWRIGIIIYEHSGFTIDVTNNKELEYGRTSIIENLTEVIGNIYDNPELLEEEN